MNWSPKSRQSLADLAKSLGRTYYAVRRRRKQFLARQLEVGQVYHCRQCGAPLPSPRKTGNCAQCNQARNRRLAQDRMARIRQRTASTADRTGLPWTDEENAFLIEHPPTIDDVIRMRRTYTAAALQRHRLLRARERENRELH